MYREFAYILLSNNEAIFYNIRRQYNYKPTNFYQKISTVLPILSFLWIIIGYASKTYSLPDLIKK
jgi:hypothetical protein